MIQLKLSEGSLAKLLTLIETLPAAQGHLFRGQSDANWELVPSLYRLTPNIFAGNVARNYDAFEAQLIDRFFREGMPYIPSLPRTYSNDRALAQHFGAPTRLLDWSEDPLVATFFAVERWDSPMDASLYMLLPESRFLPESVKNYNTMQSIAFRPPAIDRRIPAQRSVFTYHPHHPEDQPFIPLDKRPEIGSIVGNANGTGKNVRGFAKITIPHTLKRALFVKLLNIGIDRRNLFPGLDGVGADTMARAQTGHWS